ncbi:hypothetical protein [Laceyella putida]|uniref:Maturase n=1 Tax=Laceyella putida TaxID=110101 RepID=A0ABW2RGW4_9BACL
MQRAEVVLSLLSQKAQEHQRYRFRRLYRNLFNPDFYRYALVQLQGAPVCLENKSGPTGRTYIAMIESMIQQLKNETYRFAPYQLVGFPSSMKPPLKLEDHLVLVVVSQILSAIYEPLFLNSSQGFRPMPTIRSALHMVKGISGVNWIVGGELPTELNKNQHTLLMEMLRQRIGDGRFLELIRRMLDAGVWRAALLANRSAALDETIAPFPCQLLFHSLDQFMNEYARASLSHATLHYIRWGEHLLVGVKGSKRMAQEVIGQIHTFLHQELQFSTSSEPLTLIHIKEKKKVRFMGYEIGQDHRDPARLQLLVPHSVIQERIRPFRKQGKPVHYPARLHLSVPELVQLYAEEMKALYLTYRYAADVRAKLGKFRFYHYGSLLKTIASKEKSSVKQVLDKYGVQIGERKRTIAVKTGATWVTYFTESLANEERLRGNWRAGYIERCTSGSEGGRQKPVPSRDKALSVYPTKQPRL